ncbi:TPA: hypothetical protein ACW71U_002324 [Elizabethkingia anophelis]
MAVNTHIRNWIDRAELLQDYYILFVKSWIPFNAWYMHNFYDDTTTPKRDTDSSIINYINSTSNTYRDKIKSFLRGTDEASLQFKKLISDLHFELEAKPIPDYENRISLSTINLTKNNIKTHSQSSGRHTYFVEFKDQLQRTQKRWFLEVQKKSNNQTLHRVELHSWSLEELNNDIDYNAIPENEMKNQLRDAFTYINPKKPIVLIAPPKRRRGQFVQPPNSIIIDDLKHLYCTNDIDLISKAIVQMLYELRCKLFHGELDPTEANQDIYKYAYNIQNLLIKELR